MLLNISLRKDCDNSSTSGARQGGDRGENIDDNSSVNPRSDDLMSEKQDGKQYSISTLPTSVAGSEAGYDP
jgi:hypothetical protein